MAGVCAEHVLVKVKTHSLRMHGHFRSLGSGCEGFCCCYDAGAGSTAVGAALDRTSR
jgi:hypothetical protein